MHGQCGVQKCAERACARRVLAAVASACADHINVLMALPMGLDEADEIVHEENQHDEDERHEEEHYVRPPG